MGRSVLLFLPSTGRLSIQNFGQENRKTTVFYAHESACASKSTHFNLQHINVAETITASSGLTLCDHGYLTNTLIKVTSYSHIPNNSIGRNNSIGWKTTKI